jgi:hypothetical protein
MVLHLWESRSSPTLIYPGEKSPGFFYSNYGLLQAKSGDFA